MPIINHTKEFDKYKDRAEYYLARGRYIEAYADYQRCLSFSKSTTKKHQEIKECINSLIDGLIGSNLHPYVLEINKLISLKQL